MTPSAAMLRTVGWALLALVLVVMYAPVVMVFVYSFNASRIGSVWTGFSTQGYAQLPGDRALWQGLRVSLIVGFSACTLSVTLGSLAALGLRRWRERPAQTAAGLISVPLVLPDLMMGLSLALFYYALGAPKGLTTVILSHTAFGTAYAFVVIRTAVADLDDTLYHAALDCGATPWQAFWRVLLPILAPTLVIAWLLVFALSFDDYLITFFTGGVGSDTLPIVIFSRVRFGVQAKTNALFVILFFVSVLGVLLAGWLGRRRGVAGTHL